MSEIVVPTWQAGDPKQPYRKNHGSGKRRESGQGCGLELHGEEVGFDIIKTARKCC